MSLFVDILGNLSRTGEENTPNVVITYKAYADKKYKSFCKSFEIKATRISH